MTTPLLQLRGITKRYPGVIANEDVSLSLAPGVIHAVLGENGAGKSTLMKIIYGLVRPDGGELIYRGQPLMAHHPRQAREHGIAMVFQHFNLFETLTVSQNVWLGMDGALTLPTVRTRIAEVANTYGLDMDPDRPVHTLGVGEKQRVEIIRALLTQPQLLILDEPTSVLTPQAVEKLFVVLRQLADQGCSILYISHKLHEIQALCQGCTVMRSGRVVAECDPTQASAESLSRLMMGSEPATLPLPSRPPGEPMLQVEHLFLPGEAPFGVTLHGIQLTVRRGEIVGIAGVSGNGQRELMAALSGEDTRPAAEMIRVEDQGIGHWGPEQRRHLGLHSVPEERLGRGAVPDHSLALNQLLTRKIGVTARGWLQPTVLHASAQALIERYRIKANGPQATAKSLSGGNLQKYIVGREIDAQPRVLLISQPTWGVDVGAAAMIRTSLLRLRDAGCAILIVSDELEELLELSDRLHVMAQGRLSPALTRAQATLERVGTWMSGLWAEDNAC